MSEIAIWFDCPRRRLKGKRTYKHIEKNKNFFVSRYVFEVYGDDLYSRGYSFNNKKAGECLIENFLSVSANKLMEIIGNGDATNVYKNTPLYDGLLKTYKDNGGELGFTVPILKDAT